MIYIYNKKEHLKLLKKKYLNGNSENSLKLIEYSTMMNSHFDWCIRENYLELLEDLRKGKIELFEFCLNFEKTGKLTSDIIDILESNFIILSPNEKSLGFSDLLEEIFDLCVQYFQDAEFRSETSEVEFKNFEIELKNSIEKIYFQIQNYLNETG